jgi:hypothetical protein
MIPRKLGKLAPRIDPRTLKLARYLTGMLPPAPPSVDWGTPVGDWPMYLNDQIGDCTVAAAGHMIECWTANAMTADVHGDADILAAYEAISGYNPADPNSDCGAVELDVLKYWRGTGIAGHKIGAFASLNPLHQETIRQAINLFGGIYIGLALPLSAQDQDTWSISDTAYHAEKDPGSWDLHAVNIVGYDEDGLTCITWGARKRMTWEFFLTYCDEAYALISVDFLRGDGTTPDGFDMKQLKDDLAKVA